MPAPPTPPSPTPKPRRSISEPLIAHIRDLATGEIGLFSGTSEITVLDPQLAASLFRGPLADAPAQSARRSPPIRNNPSETTHYKKPR